MKIKNNVIKIGIAFVILIIAVTITATGVSPTDQTFPDGYPKYSVYADIASDIVMENIYHNYGANYSHNRNSQWTIEPTPIPMQKGNSICNITVTISDPYTGDIKNIYRIPDEPDCGKNYSHNRNSKY